ncbi:hypothetical protein RJ639_020437 [Escallonia herrerae]|uniref:RNA helicase n=1 Tax=Escallonia herrerae TaxID=1293975 RepID=A0AA89AF52_9ASTE|nr:hypothetical protein RJ639_020437 [Escallonia herrerae]
MVVTSGKDDIEDKAVDEADYYAWNELRLHPLLVKSIYRLKFKEPTPIQRACVPAAAYQGKDVFGAAETGSGKTLAFGLPILQRLLDERENFDRVLTEDREADAKIAPSSVLRALIITPTRELALQVTDHLKEIAKGTNVRVVPIVGGISTLKQERLMKARPEIVVGTPGRLWELISGGEAHLVESIIDMLPVNSGSLDGHSQNTQNCVTVSNFQRKKRQTLVFSATIALSADFLKKLKGGSLKSNPNDGLNSIETLSEQAGMRANAAIVDLTNTSIVARRLEESFIQCREEDKDAFLYYILSVHGQGRTIVFCTSIAALRHVSSLLDTLGIKVCTLHAQMQQRARLKIRKCNEKMHPTSESELRSLSIVINENEGRVTLANEAVNAFATLDETDVPRRSADEGHSSSMRLGWNMILLAVNVISFGVKSAVAMLDATSSTEHTWLEAIDRFRGDENGKLLATDVAARGLDIPGVRTVVHYQLPHAAEVYVHRSGRTARASADGCSIALISPNDTSKFAALCKSFSKESFQQFPVETSYMPEVFRRLSLARQIDKIERKASQENANKRWIERNAESVELVVEDEDSEEERVNRHKKKKASSIHLNKLQQELKLLLSRPLQPKTLSHRYLAGAGISPLLQSQFEEMAREKKVETKNSGEVKRSKLVVMGHDRVEPLEALRSVGHEVFMDMKGAAERRKHLDNLRRKRKEEKKRLHDQRRKLRKKLKGKL